MLYIIEKNDFFSEDVQLEASFYLDKIIKDQSFIFSNSCVIYFENKLTNFFQNKEKEIPHRIVNLFKDYIKERGLDNWINITNILIDELKSQIISTEYLQKIIDILNQIFEYSSKIINEETNEIVKNKKYFLIN